MDIQRIAIAIIYGTPNRSKLSRYMVLSGTIERAEERSRERLFERSCERSCERSHERLCERIIIYSSRERHVNARIGPDPTHLVGGVWSHIIRRA